MKRLKQIARYTLYYLTFPLFMLYLSWNENAICHF